MESSLLFFLVGLTIFLVSILVRIDSQRVRLILFTAAGFVSASVVGKLSGQALYSNLNIPWSLYAVVGGLAGVVLYVAERLEIITRPGIRYMATIILAAVIFGAFYTLTVIYYSIIKIDYSGSFLPFTLLLISFVIVFGYTLPVRFIGQKKGDKN